MARFLLPNSRTKMTDLPFEVYSIAAKSIQLARKIYLLPVQCDDVSIDPLPIPLEVVAVDIQRALVRLNLRHFGFQLALLHLRCVPYRPDLFNSLLETIALGRHGTVIRA